MFLIVGLGNPGAKYSMNRHNIGFMVCDYWLKSLNGSDYKEESKALTKKFKIEDTEVLLVKPQTYMNLSGESVVPLMNYYKIPKENLLVIHDDIDLPFGTMKIQHNRGPGGQNGVKSISQQLGHNEYARLKMGVGRPSHPDFAVSDYVLGNFPKEEAVLLDQYLEKAADAIESFMFDGLSKASTKFNGAVKFT
ncbi:MAG: peptidyl-tRNA hydrolase [Pseudobdellovibrio sp.]|jgi:PTH1 family peptidyl-tRNA hydrolase|nr:peptidyl-tRNA hydrolase [Pseudobdellovibrio sp.]